MRFQRQIYLLHLLEAVRGGLRHTYQCYTWLTDPTSGAGVSKHAAQSDKSKQLCRILGNRWHSASPTEDAFGNSDHPSGSSVAGV